MLGSTNFVGQTFSWVKILGVNNFWGSKIDLCQTKFCVRNLWGATFLGVKNIWGSRNVGAQKLLGVNIFCGVNKNFGGTNFGLVKIYRGY